MLDLVAWPADPDDVGFLFLDRNGNGCVDNGSELFGNNTPLTSGALAEHGFAALREFDLNDDEWVDSRDSVFSVLSLWRDLNRNGVCEVGETATVYSHGIRGLDTAPRLSKRVDEFGNTFKYAGKVRSESPARTKTAWDVFPVTISRE